MKGLCFLIALLALGLFALCAVNVFAQCWVTAAAYYAAASAFVMLLKYLDHRFQPRTAMHAAAN